MPHKTWLFAGALALAFAIGAGCKNKNNGVAKAESQKLDGSAAPADPVTPTTHAQNHLVGDPERGRSLVEKFECSRCHDGTGLASAPLEKHCVHCHQEIWTDKFKAPADKIAKWKKTVGVYLNAPNLEAAGARFSSEWIASFLMKPRDLRPHMVSSMPRLGVTEQQAADIAAYLTRNAPPAPQVTAGDPKAGRQVLESKACGTCHTFSGVADLPVKPSLENADDKARTGIELAPDLRGSRERMTAAQLVRWLINPPAVKPSTPMPSFSLTEQEARDAAAYILTTPLAPVVAPPAFTRLPVLDKKVTYEDVDREVLHKTCRHCHTNPALALGDGGPGMTGGFGFVPRRLDFSSYEGVLKGLLDPKGERISVFTPLKDGTPRLVAALLIRHKEEAGEIDPDVRGMPLGLPALTPEQIQIVESWIAQGRPQ